MDEAARKFAEAMAKMQEAIKRAVEIDPSSKNYHSLDELMKRRWTKIDPFEDGKYSPRQDFYDQIKRDSEDIFKMYGIPNEKIDPIHFGVDYGKEDSQGDVPKEAFRDASDNYSKWKTYAYGQHVHEQFFSGSRSGKTKWMEDFVERIKNTWVQTKDIEPRNAFYKKWKKAKKKAFKIKSTTAQANFESLNQPQQ